MVLHDRIVVVGCVQVQSVHFVECVRQTCKQKKKGKTATRSLILNVLIEEVLTWLDVLPQDADVSVPVGATLFVVEAEGVEQLMLDGAVVQAALTIQRQGLGVTPATHVRVAPACRQQSQQQLHLLSKKKK